MVKTSIRQASLKDLELIKFLFDRYRIFYGQKSDLDRATEFISSYKKLNFVQDDYFLTYRFSLRKN
jgi:hypothetical protein